MAAAAAAFQGVGGGRLLRAAADAWALEDGPRGRRIRRRKSPPFLVLIYHRVHPRPSPFMIDAVPPARFERQMRHLARAYRPLPLEELAARSRDGTVPRGAVAVTFDDGYADVEAHALPILERYGIPSTVFLVTGCVGTGRIPWHDEVLLAFQGTHRKEIRLPVASGAPGTAPETKPERGPRPERDPKRVYGGPSPPLPLSTEAERSRAAFLALALLKPLPEAERLAAVDALREELGGVDPAAAAGLMLDWDRVRAMRRAGVRFGAHTVTHPILSRTTPERARDEVMQSKRAIEEALGEEVSLFAYPNGRPGDFTEETVSLLRAGGFRAAVTTSFGANESGGDPFRFRRGTPWETDANRFALKLAYYRLRAEGRTV
jgi:peptidoglycan/xylan/chitin deacetylase (PgdA/CDA1 family)